jgi:Cu2+-exporting ATPase
MAPTVSNRSGGSGSDIAAETAGIILVNSTKDIVSLILFGKATYRRIVQNLALGYHNNVVALPLAAGVLYNQGFMSSPAEGAILMTISTVGVVFNDSLLKAKS